MMVYAWQQFIIAEVSDVENFDIFHGEKLVTSYAQSGFRV